MIENFYFFYTFEKIYIKKIIKKIMDIDLKKIENMKSWICLYLSSSMQFQ